MHEAKPAQPLFKGAPTRRSTLLWPMLPSPLTFPLDSLHKVLLEGFYCKVYYRMHSTAVAAGVRATGVCGKNAPRHKERYSLSSVRPKVSVPHYVPHNRPEYLLFGRNIESETGSTKQYALRPARYASERMSLAIIMFMPRSCFSQVSRLRARMLVIDVLVRFRELSNASRGPS